MIKYLGSTITVMAKFRSGFQRSAREVGQGLELLLKLFVLGIIITAIGGAFAASHIPMPIDLSGFYATILVIVELAGIISTAAIIMKMPRWGTLYMLGWIVGFLFFWHIGLVNLTDTLVYTVPSVIVLAIRLYNKTGYDNYSGGYLTG